MLTSREETLVGSVLAVIVSLALVVLVALAAVIIADIVEQARETPVAHGERSR